MSLKDLIIQSQLIPPRNRQGILLRNRISDLLSQALDYPLTIVQAGTGYGKSTELAAMSDNQKNFFWYSVRETDRDPFLFLANLFAAFSIHGSEWGISALENLEKSPQTIHVDLLRPLLNALTINNQGESVLVIDDFHHVADIPEIEMIVTHIVEYCPPGFHLILSTRKTPNYQLLARWRVKGMLKIISRNELAFQRDEILALFHDQFHYPITVYQAGILLKETEGWAIAIQMIWQSLQNIGTTIEDVLYQRPNTLEALFDYLASEVLERLPEMLQRFLITTSVLNQIEPEVADFLLDISNSQEIIQSMQEGGLFIYSVGEDVYQYQNLFHDFLRTKLWENPSLAKDYHRKIAKYFLHKNKFEAAIYHLLEAEEYEKAGNIIVHIGQSLVDIGRLDSLTGWINLIPDRIKESIGGLQLLLGDIRRLKSDFEEALSHFIKAEKIFTGENDALGQSFALRGQAQIYLDTIRPLKAEALLEEALRLLEPQEYLKETAALLDQLAENKLNLGHPDQAQSLHHEAQLLRSETDPGDVYLESRASLRTGHLAEARALLTPRAEEELTSAQSRSHNFHRETQLLLSLICIFQGDTEAATFYAREGIIIGKRLNSQFVEAVGFIRLAHPYEIRGLSSRRQILLDEAEKLYNQAIEKVRMFKVTRVQVEPLWGLSRLYGFQGRLLEAEDYAAQAKNIALQAGDKWLYHLVNLSLASSYSMVGKANSALQLLFEAFEGFKQVADSYAVAACLLWMGLTYWSEGEIDQAIDSIRQLIPLVKAGKYECLLTRPTYLGQKDEQSVVPLLLTAIQRGIEKDYIEKILKNMGLEGLDYHPGYTLHVQLIGVFDVFRGDSRVHPSDWQREKAKQLFQLLLIYKDEWLQRDQIVDRLWPELSPDAASRDFKVALNALNKALEPERPKGEQPFFIIRRDNLYSINPQAKIIVDTELLADLAHQEDEQSLQEAIQLFKGEFLPDSLYYEWTDSRRAQIKQQFLLAAERLANIYYAEKNYEAVFDVCEQILSIEPTWEMAYRLLMRTHATKNNRAQIFQVFQRCEQQLELQLGVSPSEDTVHLFEELTRFSKI